MEERKQFLSVKQAAYTLGIGRTKLYELINSGRIGAVKLGRRTLIIRSSLDSLIAHLLLEVQ